MPPLHCEGSCRANLVANNVDEDVNDLGGVELRRHCEAVMIEEEEEKVQQEERVIYIGD